MIFYKGHKVYMNGEYPAVYVDGHNSHVHRLVWEEHNGKIPDDCIVHHVDGNKLNFDISNLMLLSRKEHIRHHKDIVHRPGIHIIAMKNGEELSFGSIQDAALACGTYSSNIQRILSGRQKHANGWTFRKVGD